MLSLPPELLFFPSWLSSIPNADSSPPSPTFVPLSPPWSLVIITFGVCHYNIVKSLMKTGKLSVSLQQWGNIRLHVTGYLIWRDLRSVNLTKLPLRSEIGQSSQTTSSLTQIMSAICSGSPHTVCIFQTVPALGVEMSPWLFKSLHLPPESWPLV